MVAQWPIAARRRNIRAAGKEFSLVHWGFARFMPTPFGSHSESI